MRKADRLGILSRGAFFVFMEVIMDFWRNFQGGNWQEEINLRDFIQKNYTTQRLDVG